MSYDGAGSWSHRTWHLNFVWKCVDTSAQQAHSFIDRASCGGGKMWCFCYSHEITVGPGSCSHILCDNTLSVGARFLLAQTSHSDRRQYCSMRPGLGPAHVSPAARSVDVQAHKAHEVHVLAWNHFNVMHKQQYIQTCEIVTVHLPPYDRR